MALCERIARKKRAVLFLLLICMGVGIGVFGFAEHAYAQGTAIGTVGEKLAQGFGYLVNLILGLVGKCITILIYIIIAVASYNDFIFSTAVAKGWGIVRDICNMFFVLVLLAIAAGTILQQEKYHYSRTLPKLILMAILINFSRTICGLLIDFAQVVMMTFVGAFSAAGPGNFMAMLGVQNVLKMTEGSDVNYNTIFISLIFGLIYSFIALVVLAVIAIQLIIRIVAIWFLVTLSPFAFFLSAVPIDMAQQLSGRWWKNFANYVILGPVLAFFLWISLAVTQNAAEGKKDASDVQIHRELGDQEWPDSKDPKSGALSVGTSIAGTAPGIAGFILGIVMLLASLVAAQELSSVGGGIAAGAMNKMKSIGAGTAAMPFKLAGAGAKAGAAGAKKVGAGAVQLAKSAPAGIAAAARAGATGAGKAGAAIGSFAKGSAKAVPGIAGAAGRAGIGALKSAGKGAVRLAGTMAKTDVPALGKAGAEGLGKLGGAAKEKASTGMQAALGAARTVGGKFTAGAQATATKVGSVYKNPGEAFSAAKGALSRGAQATGNRVMVGVGTAAVKADKAIEGGKKKFGEINKATDIGVLAKKAGEAIGDTSLAKGAKEEWDKSKGLHELFKKPEPPPVKEKSELEDLKSMAEETLGGGRPTDQKPFRTLTPMGGGVAQKPESPPAKEKNEKEVKEEIGKEMEAHAAKLSPQPAQPSHAGKISRMENDLTKEQEDQKRIQKGRKQAEAALLGLDPNAEGYELRKVTLGATAKNLTDQEKAKGHTIEDLKARIQEEKQKLSDDRRFGTGDKGAQKETIEVTMQDTGQQPPPQGEDTKNLPLGVRISRLNSMKDAMMRGEKNAGGRSLQDVQKEIQGLEKQLQEREAQRRPERQAQNAQVEKEARTQELQSQMSDLDRVYKEATAIQDPHKRTEETRAIDRERQKIARELGGLSGGGEETSGGARAVSSGPSGRGGGGGSVGGSSGGGASVKSSADSPKGESKQTADAKPSGVSDNTDKKLKTLNQQQAGILKNTALSEGEKIEQLGSLTQAQGNLINKKENSKKS
ncbi:hypothetical protein HYW94_01485 [Candidatus Uhrbacteria bacterium]|nr:hypothetical protein [Candidatus Uhrbacteria bacterium]